MRLVHALVGLFGGLLMACAPVDASTPPQDNGSVVITLTRGACFGHCPIYMVSITGDGQVTYVGRNFVNVIGEQRATISPDAVRALLRRFDDVGFANLQDEYRARVSDLPTFTIALQRNGATKTVVDYAGVSAGMPRAVRDLEAEIDRVANTAQWVLREGQPVGGPRPQP
jgi:hypothetical protein